MIVLLLLLAVNLPSWLHETNSRAASARGERAYAEKQYREAARWFARAQELAPSPRGAFNLGTARIAAGERELGSETLRDAMADPSLRPDALFNRGNSALAAKALDHAIRDYVDTLKLRPNHAGAKRNLEIALARRAAAQRAAASGAQQNQPGANQQQQQPAPASGPRPQPEGQPDLEALLRSVQQQEEEELRRMKGRAVEGRVGW
jgi:tetratricopeptide (TPR) repeat protein